MENDTREDRYLAKAEAARRFTRLQQGIFWTGTERRLTRRRHYTLISLHARRTTFPTFAAITSTMWGIRPWGEVATVSDIACCLSLKPIW
jgi:hypothetical protein